uniref:NADH-ubiquinone oxidoreductase chain 6 n=1 Tax=Euoniticellus intermedius TaxID=206744 RepID=A0A1X9HF35_9SCAR|nr:NADH deshydrogenase subunit 6 [Euoniticellus intermedius]
MLMIMTLSILMVGMKHPLSMGLMLLIQTINLALYMGYYNVTYWFSYILFLIMIGGMLILFIYMTSVASNEKFYPSMKLFIITLMITMVWMIFYTCTNPMYLKINFKNEIIEMNKINIMLTKYINFPNNYIYYLLIIYLLISMLVIIQLTNFKKSGTLRSSMN